MLAKQTPPRVCLRAARLLLDYGWGKPRAPRRAPAAQEGKGQVRVVVRHVVPTSASYERQRDRQIYWRWPFGAPFSTW